MNESNAAHLLKQVELLVSKNEELLKTRGDTFNVFSVLKVESLEDRTHSAMLAELLNPDGSHLMGNVFLNLFLQVLRDEFDVDTKLDINKVKVTKEKHIGEKNMQEVTGGRVDIHLTDGEYSVSIENKIYAGEQPLQLERYSNENPGKNTVIFLTLDGKTSQQAEDSGIDYQPISYRATITNWLNSCMEKSVSLPILSNTIRQYILLIKKLTRTMDKELENELTNLVLDNRKSAESISKTLETFHKLRGRLYGELQVALNKELQDFEVRHKDWKGGKPISKITISKSKNVPNEGYIAIEGIFPNEDNFEGKVFIGKLKFDPDITEVPASESCITKYWGRCLVFKSLDGGDLHTDDTETLKILLDDVSREELIKSMVAQTLEFLENNKPEV